eukprot:CAMPEP_0172926946 /NCGR_PEP_ID=MMETSP1075-20121228/216575_1 /TAXON_ID=2916 /ORGANISM="Ceratium fusus, Strain PA161109" /LENGTH=111 /DNA_ID=CAMNT_0013788111 /DNA_START=256 /DNA_END=591 /DNA_ORIENTATION=-
MVIIMLMFMIIILSIILTLVMILILVTVVVKVLGMHVVMVVSMTASVNASCGQQYPQAAMIPAPWDARRLVATSNSPQAGKTDPPPTDETALPVSRLYGSRVAPQFQRLAD